MIKAIKGRNGMLWTPCLQRVLLSSISSVPQLWCRQGRYYDPHLIDKGTLKVAVTKGHSPWLFPLQLVLPAAVSRNWRYSVNADYPASLLFQHVICKRASLFSLFALEPSPPPWHPSSFLVIEPPKVGDQHFVTLSPEKASIPQMHDDIVNGWINWPGFLAEK